MKMKHFVIFTALFVFLIFIPNTFAQDSPQWHLPKGTKAQLGKGEINDIQYSPDGTRLAGASDIGVWLHDAQTGKKLDLLIGPTSQINSIAFSMPSGTLVVSSKTDELGESRFSAWTSGSGVTSCVPDS